GGGPRSPRCWLGSPSSTGSGTRSSSRSSAIASSCCPASSCSQASPPRPCTRSRGGGGVLGRRDAGGPLAQAVADRGVREPESAAHEIEDVQRNAREREADPAAIREERVEVAIEEHHRRERQQR